MFYDLRMFCVADWVGPSPGGTILLSIGDIATTILCWSLKTSETSLCTVSLVLGRIMSYKNIHIYLVL